MQPINYKPELIYDFREIHFFQIQSNICIYALPQRKIAIKLNSYYFSLILISLAPKLNLHSKPLKY